MGQHEITQKHTYLMGNSTYQKGTGTFVVVLVDVAACLAALSQSVTSGTDLDGYLLQIDILLAGPTWLSQSVTTGEDYGC